MSEQKYDDTNRGALFPSEKKTEKHPDLKGKLNVNGEDFYLSAWSQVSKAGKKYLSITVDKPREAEAAPAVAQASEALPF
tara:strand:+ start:3132 stop:3371 length:240 start_codon:yes stop_codon:yes gene_type:complete